ncbi:PREDICTED: protein FAM227B isoform X1 [Chinchilla lanigera]|uniref:Family with sequence similarity 227 member B n=1 Tax=Chinchilla lanigera TaxID=34839 RepID=A0A8C2VGE7_CHILA|nr:PREDICTED: protein FAM227B isoform X1 [Chinchilla lanigera]
MAGQRKLQWLRKAGALKMQEPPKSIEEFLKFQNWDYWPREIKWTDNDTWIYTLKKIKEDSSFTSIYTQLWNNVPRIFETITAMDSRLKECSHLLQDHASKLFEQDSMISRTSSYEKLKKYKAFIKKYGKQKKIMLSDEMETEKNIEGYNFSGFKTSELTELPRHLDAKRIYLFILKSHNFDERVLRIWKMHFLSEASIALLHDCFWWWFLHKFKPDRKDQDRLFDRIAESYVTLFMSIPISRKDPFLQVYPDCLTQAIYATFLEAFPESSNLFNDQFKEDLGNNIFLWLSGLKPQKGFWTHWKLDDLSSTTIHGSRKARAKSIQERIRRSQERISASIDFSMTKILKNPRAYTMSSFKEDSGICGPTAKSHYTSPGPEFYRILFNFGGQSPVILYYLKMHELEGVSNTPKQKKIKFTEILQEPAPAPTYCEVIKEARRRFASNQREFRIEMQRINEEIKLLRQQQQRINKEVGRLQIKATKKPFEVENEFEKFLHKLHTKAQKHRELVTSAASSSPAATADCKWEEEGREGKPKASSIPNNVDDSMVINN